MNRPSSQHNLAGQRYPLAMNTFGEAEIAVAKRTLDSGQLTMGQQVEEFERQFAEYVATKHALMVNSGSSANLLIVDALLRRSTEAGLLAPGDEVLVPALSWPTTVWPLIQLGLNVVFVDIDPETLAIDLTSADTELTPRTKALFLIHVLGRAAPMADYVEFCKANKLVLIEDSCETVGAYSGSKHAGTTGLMGSFSCYFSHHISTIEGGMIVTDDDALADDLRSARSHGWIRGRSDRKNWAGLHANIDERFLFVSSGFNVRPTEIQGAIGQVQLAQIETAIGRRVDLARMVRDHLKNASAGVELIGAQYAEETHPRQHSWMTLPMRVTSSGTAGRDRVVQHFENAGVETRPIIAGNLARHPGFLSSSSVRSAPDLRQSDALLEQGLMIGCHPDASEESLGILEQAIQTLPSVG